MGSADVGQQHHAVGRVIPVCRAWGFTAAMAVLPATAMRNMFALKSLYLAASLHAAPCVLPLVMVLKRSWPAVSHICSLIHLLSSKIFLILKSMLHTQRPISARRPGCLAAGDNMGRAGSALMVTVQQAGLTQ